MVLGVKGDQPAALPRLQQSCSHAPPLQPHTFSVTPHVTALQCLLAARAVDATTAAQLTSPHTALRVTYTTAAELTTVGKTLGLELTLTLGQRYCYSLPTIPPTQHCQVGSRLGCPGLEGGVWWLVVHPAFQLTK